MYRLLQAHRVQTIHLPHLLVLQSDFQTQRPLLAMRRMVSPDRLDARSGCRRRTQMVALVLREGLCSKLQNPMVCIGGLRS